jgi:Host cell surface-exposed lipoprotein
MDTNTQVKPVETPPAAKAKKPIYKRWWAIALAAAFVIGGISQAMGGGDDAQPVADKSAASAPVKEKSEPNAEEAPAPKPKPVPPKPTMTVAQKEALEAAESYLESGHFSKKGLFDQLTSEYGEGFAKKDVTFALNHVKADYNAEAREAAESYLDSGHFSHNSLMDQLTSEYGAQFTKAQAAQAVKSVGL